MTIDEAIRWAWELLTPTSPSARLDAEVLLAHALKKDRTFLTAYFEKPLSFWEKRRYKKLVAKRKEGRPVAYLTSEKEFYGLLLEVNPDTLIPRPDTEILVEEVVAYIRGLKMGELRGNPLLLDIGTGTGCIPIAVLSELRTLTAIATDVSKKALMVAGRNLKRYGLSGRVELRHSHLLRDLSPALFSSSEVILTANLPYIPRKFRIDPSTKYEPDLALYGGEDGLELYKELAAEMEALEPRALFVELFDFQAAILALHMKGYALQYSKQMTGQAQLAVFERID